MNQSKFFNKLSSHLNIDLSFSNDFILCLKKILKILSLNSSDEKISHEININNVEKFSQELGFLLSATSVPTIKKLKRFIFPMLVQMKNREGFFVIDNNALSHKNLFNPKTNQYELIDAANICRAWKCIPLEGFIATTVFSLFRKMFKNSYQNIFFLILFSVLSSLTVMVFPLVSNYIFTHLYDVKQDNVVAIFFIFSFSFLFYILILLANDFYLKWFFIKQKVFLLGSAWFKAINLPVKFYSQFTSGDFTQRFSDYESSISVLMPTIFSGFCELCSFMFLLIYLFFCNINLAILCFFIYVTFFIIKIVFLLHKVCHVSGQMLEQGKFSSFLNEVMLQINKIRCAYAENRIYKKCLQRLVGVKIFAEKSTKMDLVSDFISSFSTSILMLLCYLAFYFYQEKITTQLFIQLMVCVSQLSIAFDRLSSNISNFLSVVPGLKRIQFIIDESNEMKLGKNDNVVLLGHLKMSNVSLFDQESGRYILQNISMDFPENKFIAIVGYSGSGKSTILKLLLGLEKASSGIMTIDNENIDHLNMDELRKQIGVVLQTTNIFPGTIFSNLSANTPLTSDEAWQLAKCVGLDEDIHQMPMKMYTYISDNAGESISGGQKQKILIARALSTQPKILLLDEATSALDNLSQVKILNYLQQLNITRIMIAHRYSTIVNADIIYVLDQGKVVDVGSYEDLIKRGRLI